MRKHLNRISLIALISVMALFASCKDWQEDIDRIDAEIESIKDQLAGLQSDINNGAVIKEVVATDNGIKITLSNGTSHEITNGTNGKDGENGVDGTPGSVVEIGENGNWWIDGKDSEIPAKGAKGDDGLTPFIGENGNWWVGDTDTGVKAQGDSGENGSNGSNGLTPFIGENGNWWVGDTDTGVKAQGNNGQDGSNGSNGADGDYYYPQTDPNKIYYGNWIHVDGTTGKETAMISWPSWIISTESSSSITAIYDANGILTLHGLVGNNGEELVPVTLVTREALDLRISSLTLVPADTYGIGNFYAKYEGTDYINIRGWNTGNNNIDSIASYAFGTAPQIDTIQFYVNPASAAAGFTKENTTLLNNEILLTKAETNNIFKILSIKNNPTNGLVEVVLETDYQFGTHGVYDPAMDGDTYYNKYLTLKTQAIAFQINSGGALYTSPFYGAMIEMGDDLDYMLSFSYDEINYTHISMPHKEEYTQNSAELNFFPKGVPKVYMYEGYRDTYIPISEEYPTTEVTFIQVDPTEKATLNGNPITDDQYIITYDAANPANMTIEMATGHMPYMNTITSPAFKIQLKNKITGQTYYSGEIRVEIKVKHNG